MMFKDGGFMCIALFSFSRFLSTSNLCMGFIGASQTMQLHPFVSLSFWIEQSMKPRENYCVPTKCGLFSTRQIKV
ncbi:hypothetical protein EDD21DRAFT_390238 [Dissophora ornata]|nr:hypothetical protein EDD21DRAFT_390238 [Dissophora ornata]